MLALPLYLPGVLGSLGVSGGTQLVQGMVQGNYFPAGLTDGRLSAGGGDNFPRLAAASISPT